MSRVKLMDHQLAMLLKCIQVENLYNRPKTIRVQRPKDVLRNFQNTHKDDTDDSDGDRPRPVIGLMMDKPGVGKTFAMLSLILADMERKMITKDNASNGPTVIIVPGHLYHQWWQAMLQIFGVPPKGADTSTCEGKSPHPGVSWCKVRTPEDAKMALYPECAEVMLVHMACYDLFMDSFQQTQILPRRIIIDEADGYQASRMMSKVVPCDVTWLVSCTLLDYVEECIALKEDFHFANMCVPAKLIPEVSCICEDDFVNESIILTEPDERFIVCPDELVDDCICNPETNLSIDRCTFKGMVNALHDPLLECPIYDMNDFAARCIKNGYAQPITRHIIHATEYYAPVCNDNDPLPALSSHESMRPFDRHVSTRPASSFFGIPGSKSIYKHADIPLSFGVTTEHTIKSVNEHIEDNGARNSNRAIETRIIETYETDVSFILSNSKRDALSDVLHDIVRNNTDGRPKVIIASLYDTTLELVERVLDKCGFSWGRLHGGEDDEAIESTLLGYQEGNIHALLINAWEFGTGLNLQCTTDIIMMHAMSDKTRLQLIGRAQRPGRTTTLRVWHMAHKNEVSSQHDMM